MTTKSLPVILFLSILSFALHAQIKDACNFELKGRVLDADTKEAIPYAQIKVSNSERFAITDINGEFHVKELCNESSTLHISCIGYGDVTCTHSHQQSKSSPIYLKPEAKSLDAVTVTGEKRKEEGTISVSQVKINREVLSSAPTQTLASALSEVEGVTFTSIGSNIQIPVIHGLYGNRVLILNNGLKHGFQNWGSDHAPEIDVSTADNVTIIKGAAGVRYGPEALAGAVLVEADQLRLNEPLKGKVGTGYETNGRGYFVNSKISQGWKKLSYHVGANYTRIGDRHAPDYSLTNTGKEELSFNAGLRYNLDNLDFKVYYSFIDQNLGLLRASALESGDAIARAINADRPNSDFIKPFSYDIKEPNQLAKHHLGKIEVNWRYADDAKLTLRIGRQFNQREEYDVRRNADRPIINLDLTTTDYQLEWKHPSWFQLDGLIGLQVFTQNNDNIFGTSNAHFIPNYNTFRFSSFLIESFERDKNTFELGVRLDHEHNDIRGRDLPQNIFRDDYTFTNLTASLGFIRQLSGNATFRSNIGMAWRTPNVAELFSFGQHGFKLQYGLLRYIIDEEGKLDATQVFNLAESDVSAEVGYKWINEWQVQKNANTFTITAYTHYIEDFIFDRPFTVTRTFRGPNPAFIFDQANALFLGTDLTWQRDWSNTVKGTFGLSYLWSRNIERNEPLIGQPPITTSYKLVWDKQEVWKFSSSQLSIKPSYTFRQFQAPRFIDIDDINNGTATLTQDSEIFDYQDARTDDRLSGYFLFDVAWQFKIKQFGGSLSVNNVFNARYRDYLNEMRYFADEPGRNFLFTLNYFFNSNSN